MFLFRREEMTKHEEWLEILKVKNPNKGVMLVNTRKMGKNYHIQKWQEELEKNNSVKADLRVLLLLVHLSFQPNSGFSSLPIEIVLKVAKRSMLHIKFAEHITAEFFQYIAQYQRIYNSGYHGAIVLWKPPRENPAQQSAASVMHHTHSVRHNL